MHFKTIKKVQDKNVTFFKYFLWSFIAPVQAFLASRFPVMSFNIWKGLKTKPEINDLDRDRQSYKVTYNCNVPTHAYQNWIINCMENASSVPNYCFLRISNFILIISRRIKSNWLYLTNVSIKEKGENSSKSLRLVGEFSCCTPSWLHYSYLFILFIYLKGKISGGGQSVTPMPTPPNSSSSGLKKLQYLLFFFVECYFLTWVLYIFFIFPMDWPKVNQHIGVSKPS